jgi:hypothetical protein
MRANILFDASSQAIHGLLAVAPVTRNARRRGRFAERQYAPVQTR